MSAPDEFEQLPKWLQDLWNSNAILARKAESELDALRAELAEYRTLRPAKCRPACWRGGWDAAINAAAKAAEGIWNLPSVGGGIYEHVVTDHIAEIIRVIEPPADFGGACNPLEPDAPECQHEYQTGVGQWMICNSCGEKV